MRKPTWRQRSLPISLAVGFVLVAAMAWLRLDVFGRIALPVGYGLPVVIAAWTRNRRVFWSVILCFALLTIWKFGYQLNRIDPAAKAAHAWSGALVLADLFIIAAIVDLLIKSWQELDQRRREAEEASVRKTRFLAAVSHDIRTPANAISLLAELIQRTTREPDGAAEIGELARELQYSSIGLVNLVSDVLDLTRLDSGKVELNPVEFDLGQWLTEECGKLQLLAEEKKLKFECVLPPTPVRMRCDRIKLGRVLTNLVGNAIKYTERGEVSVRVDHADGGPLRLTVRDTGIGIPAEHLTHIFDEFFQLRNPERDRQKGSGLGLSITKRLLDAMGGQLTVQSAIGRGSTFTATLPASAVVG